jgi:hypothetical protein
MEIESPSAAYTAGASDRPSRDMAQIVAPGAAVVEADPRQALLRAGSQA